MERIPNWLLTLVALLALTLLATLQDRKTRRSALYVFAVKAQYAICFCAALLPVTATVIEELPDRFVKAWRRERGEFEIVRPIKSA
jgi:hypothetical protein